MPWISLLLDLHLKKVTAQVVSNSSTEAQLYFPSGKYHDTYVWKELLGPFDRY